MGQGQHELEDVFGADYYISMVNDVLSKKLAKKVQIGKNELQNEKTLLSTQIVQIAKKKFNTELRKDDVAWHFRELVQSEAGKITEEITNRFKQILIALFLPGLMERG